MKETEKKALVELFEEVEKALRKARGELGACEGDARQAEGASFTVDGVTFEMVPVEGGTFTMGATAEQGGADDRENPAHEVTVSGFAIGKYPVTQALWEAVMGENPSMFEGNSSRPVESVSWEDCREFIEELNARLGLPDASGRSFRLPTEAEWEYAARGGNRSRGYRYSGSDDIGEVAWYDRNSSNGTTHPVGEKGPNELGVYDMSGNVWEWCGDWYGNYPSEAERDPTGPSSGSSRVLRGGSWDGNARGCRVSYRYYSPPGSGSRNFGLRLVLA